MHSWSTHTVLVVEQSWGTSRICRLVGRRVRSGELVIISHSRSFEWGGERTCTWPCGSTHVSGSSELLTPSV